MSNSNEYVVLSQSELTIRKGEIMLTGLDVETLMEHQEVFIRFINKGINKIQADLGNFKYVGREAEATIEVNTLRELIKSITKTAGTYKAYIKAQEDKK